MNPEERFDRAWMVARRIAAGQGITDEDIDAENVAVRQIVTCTLPGDMI